MLKLEPGVANPWDYRRLEDFLFFLCPECTYQTQDGDEFLGHSQSHPMAQRFVREMLEDSQNHHTVGRMSPKPIMN